MKNVPADPSGLPPDSPDGAGAALDRPAPALSDQERQRKLEEYSSILAAYQYEGQLRWTIFGTFLLAETVLLGLLGSAILRVQDDPLVQLLETLGAVLGIVLCVAWGLTFRHYTSYYTLRIYQARALEDDLGYSMLGEGATFGEGHPIERLEALGMPRSSSLGWLHRWSGTATARTFIWTFIVSYVVLAVLVWR